MPNLSPSQHPIRRKLSSSVAVGLLSALLGILLLGIANLGATETSGTESSEEATKAERTIASLPSRTVPRNTRITARLQAAKHTGSDHVGPCPRHFHDRRSLPNGLRAPLRC